MALVCAVFIYVFLHYGLYLVYLFKLQVDSVSEKSDFVNENRVQQ